MDDLNVVADAAEILDDISVAAIFKALTFGVVVTDSRQSDGPVVRVNPAFCEMTGYGPDEFLGRNCRFLQGPETDRLSIAEIAGAVGKGQTVRRTILNYRKDGTAFWNEMSLSPIRAADGALVGYVGIQRDVSEQMRQQEEARKVERRLRAVAENMPGFIFQRALKPDGHSEFLYCSPSLGRLLGYPDTVLTFDEFLSHIHSDDIATVSGAIEVSHRMVSRASVTYRLIGKDGREIWIRGFAVPRIEAGGRTVWDGCGIDVTAERHAEERLAYLACHDPLTGLENVSAFEGHIDAAISRLGQADRRAVVLALRIGELTEIRGAMGPDVADALLVALAARLCAFAGPNARVARLGDTQFAILDIIAAPAVLERGAALRSAFERSFLIAGCEVTIHPEIGLAVYPSAGMLADAQPLINARELIKRAEIAIAEDGQGVLGEPGLYSQEIDERVSKRVILRQSMHKALAEEQFEVYYQPLVDLADSKIVGAEALLRWRHPELGFRRPDEFIPLAEESGMIVPLGAWVLRQAMQQARRWDCPEFGSPKIAVNVSGVQLKRSDFFSTVQALLAATSVDPRRIELELTEGFLIGTSPNVIDTLERIRKVGVALAIDDFGTGYASYQYLKRLPVDKLKIDQIFIRQLSEDSTDASIVRAIIAMAKSLKLDVLCEGIETKLQMDFLHQEGCRLGQGYYFAEPMPASDFETLLRGREQPITASADPEFAFAAPARSRWRP